MCGAWWGGLGPRRAGFFAAVDAGLVAPLAAQEVQRLQNRLRQAEQLDQQRAVEGVTVGIVVGLVGGQERFAFESAEDARGETVLLGR